MKRGKSIETFPQFTVYMAFVMGVSCILVACDVHNPIFFIIAFIGTTSLCIYAFEAGYERQYGLLTRQGRDQVLTSYRRVLICTTLGFGYLLRELFERLARLR